MSVYANLFRGQGIRVGNRYGVIHRFASPSEIVVRFKEGFETLSIAQLLPVTAIQDVGHRFAERDIELELTPMEQHDGEIESDVCDEEKQGSFENDLDVEAEMAEEL
jgi:hypothetical protein